MGEICPICGLPVDLCVCKSVVETTKTLIKIRLEERKSRREVTIIEGLDPKVYDLKGLASKLKEKFACGGTVKNGKIELQGDHREKVRKFLIEELGIPAENIIVE